MFTINMHPLQKTDLDFITFGGYYENSFNDKVKTVFKSVKDNKWELLLNNVLYKDIKVNINTSVQFDFTVPYIYIP
jgi:hypothetical protein